MSTGYSYPQGQGYQGAASQGAYQGTQGYPDYKGGPPPAVAYPGGQASTGPFQGASVPAGTFPGGGAYPGGPASAGTYPPGGSPGGDVQVQWKGEMPDQDVDDNPNAAPVQASAPPLEKMDTVEGYGNIGFDAGSTPHLIYNQSV